MDEREWLTTSDDRAMLRFLEERTSTRKLRLYLSGAARSVWDRHGLPSWLFIVEAAEQYADGAGGNCIEDANRIRYLEHLRGERAAESQSYFAARGVQTEGIDRDRRDFLYAANHATRGDTAILRMFTYAGYSVLRRFVPDLPLFLRDVIGNPFRPVAFDPTWRTEAAVGIAAKMYDERDFRAMPILADALEEAGCDNADILSHCREPGVHVRGCWVVDLVLGKS